ncbi:MAG: glycosyltransferase family 1 protein [Verrucomicrobiota bacterium]
MSFYLDKLWLFLLGERRKASLFMGREQPGLFISVAHTAHSKVNSGIQRVTRSIAKEVLNAYPGSDLLEWFIAGERYILLDETARRKFAKYSGPKYAELDELIQLESRRVFALLSKREAGGHQFGIDEIFAYLSSEGFQKAFRRAASFSDRLQMQTILKRLKKNGEMDRELGRFLERTLQEQVHASEDCIHKMDLMIRSVCDRIGEDYRGFAPGGEVHSEPQNPFERELRDTLGLDAFSKSILANLESEVLIEEFERLIERLDHGDFRKLDWVGYLPVTQKGRRWIRRCIRNTDNWRSRIGDWGEIRKFAALVISLRKSLDEFRGTVRRSLALKSDRSQKIAMDVCRVLLLANDFDSEEQADSLYKGVENLATLTGRVFPRSFIPAKGSWVLIPELMTGEEFEGVFRFTKKHGLKVAVVFHDALPVQFPDLVSEKYRGDHESYMHAIARADCLLPVSEYSKNCYLEWANETSVTVPRIETCLNGVRFREPNEGDAAPALPSSVEDRFVLCVSTVEPRKNHLKLLEAWEAVERECSALQLVILGNEYAGFEKLAEEVSAKVSNLKRVVWLKGVSDEALESLYRGALFTVFPSVGEGFGLPILESVWYGTPCVCANFGAMAEAAEGGGCMMIDVNDADSIRESIELLVTDQSRLEELRQECETREMRTWADYAKQLGEILELA